MNDPVLGQILLTAFKYGVCGSGVAIALRVWTRHQPGPRLRADRRRGLSDRCRFRCFFRHLRIVVDAFVTPGVARGGMPPGPSATFVPVGRLLVSPFTSRTVPVICRTNARLGA